MYLLPMLFSNSVFVGESDSCAEFSAEFAMDRTVKTPFQYVKGAFRKAHFPSLLGQAGIHGPTKVFASAARVCPTPHERVAGVLQVAWRASGDVVRGNVWDGRGQKI